MFKSFKPKLTGCSTSLLSGQSLKLQEILPLMYFAAEECIPRDIFFSLTLPNKLRTKIDPEIYRTNEKQHLELVQFRSSSHRVSFASRQRKTHDDEN